MTDNLLVCTDDSLGDMICAMVAVQYMARKVPYFYLWTLQPMIEMLMRPENVRQFRELPSSQMMMVRRLDISRALNEYKMKIHPVLCYLKQQGIHLTAQELPKPEMTHEIMQFYTHEANAVGFPQYDVLIAPWAAHGQERSMTLEGLENLVRELPTGWKVGILGGPSDPKLPQHCRVDHIYGQFFGVCAAMIRYCKALVTVDSSMNRLAYACLDNGSKHIILRGIYEPEEWVYYPGVTILPTYEVNGKVQRREWDIDVIVRFVESRIAVAV